MGEVATGLKEIADIARKEHYANVAARAPPSDPLDAAIALLNEDTTFPKEEKADAIDVLVSDPGLARAFAAIADAETRGIWIRRRIISAKKAAAAAAPSPDWNMTMA